MSDLDLFISNGTCYFATNRKAADTFIPCRNAANAAYTCCLKGDVCLEGSVCFHPDGNSGGTTYIAGCTDPGFGSVAGACPHKGKLADQQIVGLVRCQDSDDGSKPDELWAGCPGDKDKTEMTGVTSPCSCSDPEYQGLFRQKPTIEAVATLPTALGQTVLFAKNHEPSPSFRKTPSPRAGNSNLVTPRPTTIIISVPTTRPSSVVVTNAPGTSSAALVTDVSVSAKETSTPDQEALSAGAKASIAVGVIFAVLLSSAIFVLAATMRRRHRRASARGGVATGAEAEAEAAAKAPLTTVGPVTPANKPPALAAAPTPPSWNNWPEPAAALAASMFNRDAAGPVHRAEGWFKPELAADESTAIASSSSPDPAAFLAAQESVPKGCFNSSSSPPHPSEHLVSSMRDSREPSLSDASSYSGDLQQARRFPFLVTPQHAGSGGRVKAMESISELQG